jgi:tetratricopeptide (TPR) repeat protein
VRALVIAVAVALCLTAHLEARQRAPFSPDQVQSLLDQGEVEAALEALDARLQDQPDDGDAMLLRSTAHLMLGNLAAGRRDLEASLALDRSQRQGWLNLGALNMAEGRYREAVEAFAAAEKLDPRAADNSLNIGAALLFNEEREAASLRFRRYLEANPKNAEAYYLVAVNYALAGRADLVMPLLRRAVDLDERIRLQIRTDASFAKLTGDTEFELLLDTDSYRMPADAVVVTRRFDAPFSGRTSPVLQAVLTALQLSGRPITGAVEVASSWALVWSDVRIRVAAEGDGTSLTISSLDHTSSAAIEDLFRRVSVELLSQRPPATQAPGSEPE